MAITWDQIGSESFIFLDGDFDPAAIELHEVTRAGVDGRAYKEKGTRGDPFHLSGLVDVTSASGANTKISTYKAMKGTVVSVRLRGQTRTNFLVLDVRVIDRKAAVNGVGGTAGGSHLVYSEWDLVYAGT